MAEFPTASIEHLEISRLIIGSNPLFGFSHYSAAKDAFLRRHFTDEKIMELLAAATEAGLNAYVSSPSERGSELLSRHERETGRHIHWISTPNGDTLEELIENIHVCSRQGAAVCMPHQNWSDNNCIVAERRLPHFEEISALIRELGMIPALSTHSIHTVRAASDGGYDIAAFITPFNSIGFLCAVETDWIGRVIRDLKTPIIVIKPLAAQRVLPPTGLQFVYDNIKPSDMVCIGMACPEEVREDVNLAREFISGIEGKREYQFTRSKRDLITEDGPPASDSSPSA